MDTDQEMLLAAIAVMDNPTRSDLEIVLNSWMGLTAIIHLENHPEVQLKNGRYSIAIGKKRSLLAAFEQRHRSLFQSLHEQAITYLARRFENGDATVESTLAQCLKRLAFNYLTDFHPGYETLIQKSEKWAFTEISAQRWQEYFTAVLLIEKEQFEAAFLLFDRLLSNPDLELSLKGRVLNSRSVGYRHVGRLEDAFDGYKEALAVWQRLGDKLSEGKVLYNLGFTAYFLQQYDETESRLSQAIDIFETQEAAGLLAAATNVMGLVSRDRGEWDQALSAFSRYIDYNAKAEADDLVGVGCLNIGEVLLYQGHIQEALASLHSAIEKMTRRVYHIDAYLGIGLAYQASGMLARAQAAFEKALALAAEIQRQDILPQIYHRLAAVHEQVSGLHSSIQFSEQAVRAIEANRHEVHDETLKIRFLGSWQQVYETLILKCFEAGLFKKAFQYAEQARARAFAELIGQSERAPVGVPVENLQAVIGEESAVLCYFSTGVLERDMPMLSAIPTENPLRKLLVTPAGTLLFIIRRHDFSAHLCPIDPNQVSASLGAGRNPKRLLNGRILPALSTYLLDSLNDLSALKLLYVLPHGPLHNVPFTALEREGTPVIFANGPALIYAPSATILNRQIRSRRSPRKGFSGAVIEFAGSARDHSLRYTLHEAREIRRIMGGQLIPGDAVDALADKVSEKEWLHFACHGWFNQKRPLDSYLEIGAGRTLSAQEVLDNWTIQAQLVTLSACQTGVSQVLRGDEPMGLIRAFLSAGAQSVLVTQWPVADLPTFLLMVKFYELWQRSDDKMAAAVALKDAQNWLRGLTQEAVRQRLTAVDSMPKDWQADVPGGERPFSHPLYWAAFILFGG